MLYLAVDHKTGNQACKAGRRTMVGYLSSGYSGDKDPVGYWFPIPWIDIAFSLPSQCKTTGPEIALFLVVKDDKLPIKTDLLM